MYQIYYDGKLLFDPRGMNCAEPGDQTYAILDGTLNLAVGAAGTESMTLPGGHPLLSSMHAHLGS